MTCELCWPTKSAMRIDYSIDGRTFRIDDRIIGLPHPTLLDQVNILLNSIFQYCHRLLGTYLQLFGKLVGMECCTGGCYNTTPSAQLCLVTLYYACYAYQPCCFDLQQEITATSARFVCINNELLFHRSIRWTQCQSSTALPELVGMSPNYCNLCSLQ